MSDNIYVCFKLERSSFTINVDITLPGKGLTVIFGHSGSGKTSLLRFIAGFEKSAQGKLIFQGNTWHDEKTFIPTYKRPMAYVFQEPSLFTHLNVEKNLNYSSKRANQHNLSVRYNDVIQLLDINRLLKQYPNRLSGGEKQRVAIARALINNPRLLLMDEPLASLDQARKQEILPYIEKLKQEMGLPILYVTHSTDEVARLADTLVAMENGQIVASGDLTQTFANLDFPISLGEESGVVIQTVIKEKDTVWGLMKVEFDGGSLWVRDNAGNVKDTVRVRVLARDVSLSLNKENNNTSIMNRLDAKIIEISEETHPGLALVKLKIGNTYLIARVTRRSIHQLGLSSGDNICAQIKSVALVQ